MAAARPGRRQGEATGRVALVTGASRGIGRAIATGLAEKGASVWMAARDAAALEAAAAELGGRGLDARPVPLDVTDDDSVRRLSEDLAAAPGRLDILVNNAGAHFDVEQRASSADLAIVRAALEVNLLGAWRLCGALVPLMRRHGYGRIVNVSSSSGTFSGGASARTPAYSVSKAALDMFTIKLAADLAGTGILVNAACPGWVRTAMGGPNAPRSPEEGAETLIWLALLPDGGPSGGLFRDRQPVEW